MATLAGMTIADRDSPFESGAAFLLAQKCDIDALVTLPSGWEVELRSGSPYVVARVKGISSPTDVFSACHEAAQQGLDLLAAQGKAHLSNRNASDVSLLWWRESSIQVLRVISVNTLSVTVGIPTLTVTDQHGNVIPQPPPPPIIYHESFRYIRLSEVTDDLFDAFRNMYLAFEALLGHVAPRHKKEREGAWLKRALATVDTAVSLSTVYGSTTGNITERIYQEIYIDIRCAIFHSKNSPRLLPHDLADRRRVSEGLRKLTRIVLLISDHWLHARRPTGVMTYAGFELMTMQILQASEILVSDNDTPFDRQETLESPVYDDAVPMATRHAPDLSEPGLNCVLGVVDVAQLCGLQKIARFGLKHDNHLIMVSTVDAELNQDGVDRLEAQLGVQLRNTREPKRLYKM